jgi:hypothetical protein
MFTPWSRSVYEPDRFLGETPREGSWIEKTEELMVEDVVEHLVVELALAVLGLAVGRVVRAFGWFPRER